MTALATSTIPGHGELRQLIVRAAQSLACAATAADVLDARDQAAFAYDAAKSAGRLARAKGAHDEVLSRAYRLQADAAEIEYLAKKRLADEYDAAQERGEVVGAHNGAAKRVPDENAISPATANDLGLSRKVVFEARQIRDAIAENPTLLREALDDLLQRGEEPTKAAVKRALIGVEGGGNRKAGLGASSRTRDERGVDAYFTPFEGIHALLCRESFSAVVKEPACGRGHISRPMEAAGYGVMLADLINYETVDNAGILQQVGDFLDSRAGDSEGVDIVTNPPYGRHILNRFVAHALREHKPRKMALLMNLNVVCGSEDADRNFYMEEQPPSRIYVFKRRLPMMHQDGYSGPEASSQMNTAWYVWERNADGTYGDSFPRMIRIDWEDYIDCEPMAPGGGTFVPSSMHFVSSEDDEEDLTRETPRYSDAQRIEMERARALVWMGEHKAFSVKEFQVGVAVRPRIAAALIETFLGEGLIACGETGDFSLSPPTWLALSATAGALAAGMTATDVSNFGKRVAHG